jgi:hypothetical protein
MVIEKFELQIKPEILSFKVANYSASLASEEALDEKLLERIL